MDNQGNEDHVADAAVGIACLYLSGRLEAEHFTRISPKSRSTLIFSFSDMRGAETIGDIFAFSAELLVFEAGKTKQFSVGISNIERKK